LLLLPIVAVFNDLIVKILFFNGMNYLDFIIGALVIISAISGYKKGLIHQLASLAALILGIFLAVKFSKMVYPFIVNHFTSSENIAKVSAFIAIFILVVIAVLLLGKFLHKTFEDVELGLINKISGSVFSIVKTIFILSAIMVLLRLSIIHLNWPKTNDIEKSALYKPVEAMAPAIFPYLKMEKEQKLNPEKK
jgi:membrane protein required for colicin V production